jgi:hypothetical protein
MLPLLISGPGKLKKKIYIVYIYIYIYMCIIGHEELDITGLSTKLYKTAICPRREYGHDNDILINMEEHHTSQHLNHIPPFNNTKTHTIHLGCH